MLDVINQILHERSCTSLREDLKFLKGFCKNAGCKTFRWRWQGTQTFNGTCTCSVSSTRGNPLRPTAPNGLVKGLNYNLAKKVEMHIVCNMGVEKRHECNKTSSRAILISSPTSAKTVGWMKYPLLPLRPPPHINFAPSFLPLSISPWILSNCSWSTCRPRKITQAFVTKNYYFYLNSALH